MAHIICEIYWAICVNKRESWESKKELGDKLAFKENSWFLKTVGINHSAGQLNLLKRQKKEVDCPSYCSRWVWISCGQTNKCEYNMDNVKFIYFADKRFWSKVN